RNREQIGSNNSDSNPPEAAIGSATIDNDAPRTIIWAMAMRMVRQWLRRMVRNRSKKRLRRMARKRLRRMARKRLRQHLKMLRVRKRLRKRLMRSLAMRMK
ncbi:unnamed protein product, partial [Brassica oleracea]